MRFLILGFLLCDPVAAFIRMTLSKETGLTNTRGEKQGTRPADTHTNVGERYHHGFTEPGVNVTVRAHIPDIISNTKLEVKQGQKPKAAEHAERHEGTRYNHHIPVSKNKDTTQTVRSDVPDNINSTESAFKHRRIADERKRNHRHGSTRRYHNHASVSENKDTATTEQSNVPDSMGGTESALKNRTDEGIDKQRYGSVRYQHHVTVTGNKEITQTELSNDTDHISRTNSNFNHIQRTGEGTDKQLHGSSRFHHHVKVTGNKDTTPTEHSNIQEHTNRTNSNLYHIQRTGEGTDTQLHGSSRFHHHVKVTRNKDTTPTEHSNIKDHISRTNSNLNHIQRTDEDTGTQLHGSSRFHHHVKVTRNKDTPPTEHSNIKDHTNRTNSNFRHIQRTGEGTDTQLHGSSRFHHHVKVTGNKDTTPTEHSNVPGHLNSPESTFKKSHTTDEHKHRHGHGSTRHHHQVTISKRKDTTQTERADISVYKNDAKSTNANKTHTVEGMQRHQHTSSNVGETAHNETDASVDDRHDNVEISEEILRVNNGHDTNNQITTVLGLQSSSALETVTRWSTVWFCIVLHSVS